MRSKKITRTALVLTLLLLVSGLGCSQREKAEEMAETQEPTPVDGATTEDSEAPQASLPPGVFEIPKSALEIVQARKVPHMSELDFDALSEEWQTLMASPTQNMHNSRTVEVVQDLMRFGEKGYMVVFETIGSPDAEPLAKVKAADCLTPFLRPTMIPILRDIALNNDDTTSRAAATHLLGGFSAQEVEPTLRELMEAPERRIRLAATLAIAARGDEKARQDLVALYDDPDFRFEEKVQVFKALAHGTSTGDMDFYAAAVGDSDLPVSLVLQSIDKLSQHGRLEDISALEAATEQQDMPEMVQAMVHGAIDKIQVRHSEDSEGATADEADQETASPIETSDAGA